MMQRKSIRTLSTLVIAGLVLFFVFYPYRVLRDLIPFTFTQPELWQNHWMVNYEGEIPFLLRLGYLILWLLPIFATMTMTGFAIHFFYLLRKGVYFDQRTVRDIQYLGLSACIAGFGVILGNSMSNWLVTFMNSEDPHGLRFGYEPTEVSLMLTGLGLYLGGWILTAVVIQDRENKEFV